MNPGGLLRLDEAVRLSTCTSTQDVCRRLASAGAPEGTLVIADEQTAGRGRENRTWHSPPEGGLYTSLLLRPRIDTSRWLALMPLVALALAQAVESLPGQNPATGCSLRILIKWPNDLFGRHGKLAGILAETEAAAVVVGVGLNLGHRREQFPPEIRERASSLRLEGFEPLPGRDVVLRALDASLGQCYERFQGGDRGFLREGLSARFFLEGKRVRIESAGGLSLEGIARRIGESGELIIETEDGWRSVFSGEVVRVGFLGE